MKSTFSTSASQTTFPVLLEIREAAHELRISTSLVRKLIARGELRATRIARRVLVHRDDLGDYILRARGGAS